ncbi:hypothetical protein FHD67_15545 [Paracoccus haeundaensis]|uniref:RES domain-containing protein n=2 Tax=Paracoccus haeundaensis TaxID=225362 RepID=A0A5C4R311_9RHOB|nr:hypothetical protein FHD67_15545 [Paracoccus haeundaensis]
MNPSGILTFYGAFDLDTCVAELRPAVGESVISAQFSLTRPILVLDTTQFSGKPKAENIFSSNHIEKMRLWKFMTQFMHEISKPSLPDDEHLDYIPTQVVSEYLSQIHKMKVIDQENKIDAIGHLQTHTLCLCSCCRSRWWKKLRAGLDLRLIYATEPAEFIK